jgi:AcrR family transcriptional regulator
VPYAERPPVESKRAQRKSATRTAIIEAALRLVDELGLDGTTVDQIAAAAGVSPATVFNYFPAKVDIFFADADLYRFAEPLDPRPTPEETLARALQRAVHDQPWTRPIEDPLTRLRFAVVQREPELAARQTVLLFGHVPELAEALRRAHPHLEPTRAVALTGAAVGAVVAVISYGVGDLTDRLRAAAQTVSPRP